MTSPIIPLELLECVLCLNYVENDVKTLKNCSYASHLLSSVSQKFLFQEINLTGIDTSSTENPKISHWQAFNNLLECSPHLSNYVQKLSISRGALSSMSKNNDENLVKIFGHLSKLQRICISAHGSSGKTNTEWTSISPQIQKNLLEAFRSPHLVEIDLLGVPLFPAAQLALFPVTLKRLSLTYLHFDDDEAQLIKDAFQQNSSSQLKLTTTGYCFTLEALVVHNIFQSSYILLWLLLPICPIDLSRLQELTLRVLDQPIYKGYLEKLLHRVSATVKSLKLRLHRSNMTTCFWSYTGRNVYFDPCSLPPPDVVGSLAVLESLTLESSWLELNTTEPAYLNPLPWINGLLKRLSKMELREIILKMEILINEETLEEVDWSELLSHLHHRQKSIIELVVSGLDESGKKIILDNEDLKELQKGITFVGE
ncbi:hypothetical protein BYT27DRAFT_7162539 [Phlegmacium glaucopus]|nr:hypothetical protein BYT27DRAFT_7162539 [Phlegmacium glaucopus]